MACRCRKRSQVDRDQDQRRIKRVLDELSTLADPRQKLVPCSGNLKDFWKLRVGDYRLVCQIKVEAGEYILIIRVAHRSAAYDPRSLSKIGRRSE